jgi:hypothetical protein
MEGRFDILPPLPLPPASYSAVPTSSSSAAGVERERAAGHGGHSSPKSQAEEEEDDTAFDIDEDILKLLNLRPPSRPQYNPDAPLLNISGIWTIDSTRSESMEEFLTLMGVPPLARQAASKLAHVVVIDQTESTYQITRLSKLGSNTKTVSIGDSKVVAQLGGETTMSVRVEKGAVITTTIFDNVSDPLKGQLRDTRTLIDGGATMKVVLELDLMLGARVTVNRYFNASDERVNVLIAHSPKTTLAASGGMEDLKRQRVKG